MFPYAVLFVVIIASGGLLSISNSRAAKLYDSDTLLKTQKNNRLIFCVVSFCAITLMCGLRSVFVGFGDNLVYADMFYNTRHINFSDVALSFFSPEKLGGGSDSKDLFFVVLINFLRLFSSHHQIVFLFFGALSYLGPMRLIYRYSENPLLSVLLFLAIGPFLFAMTGVRQAAAMGIACFSFPYLVERKPLRFFIVLLVAATIHKMILVFALAYFLNFRFTKKVVVGYLVFLVILFVSSDFIANLFLLIGSSDARVDGYFGAKRHDNLVNSMGFIIHVTVVAYCFINYRNALQKTPLIASSLFHIVAVGVCFHALTTLQASIFARIAMPFSLYEMLLVPLCVQTYNDTRIKAIVSTAILCCCVFYFFYSNIDSAFNPYKFFWNDSSINFN